MTEIDFVAASGIEEREREPEREREREIGGRKVFDVYLLKENALDILLNTCLW